MRGQLTPINESDAVAILGFVHVVCCHKNGYSFAGEFVDQVPKPASADGVHSRSWLVEENDGRLMEDRASQSQSLLPTAREDGRSRAPVLF